MNKELELWQFAAERLKRDESVMLLVVAESSGSSPGRQGFKMIVARDDLTGSIGGGVMEVRLAETAKWKMENGKWKMDSEIVEQIHQKSSPNASGMICSGKQTVIFFQLVQSHLKTIRQIIRALENHQSKTLQISSSEFRVTPSSVSSPQFLTPEGVTLNPDFYFAQSGKTEFLYEEKLGCKQKLFIIGGGHCALALSEIAAKMDFYITLFDDREDLNTLAKNEFADEKKVIESYEQIGEFISSGGDVYVVVMTLGYKFDEIVIRQLIDKNFKYFGVLGSRAKMKVLLKNLETEGFPKERLKNIHTPIGLPINSRTPPEIAVSIAAEIIKVKNSRN
ncbi:MAG: XdhC family protein [Pyrinomonadaceae bacterium]|nr:XdhC family protein [Pyrinomonadaceae bacterium]